MHTVFGLIGAKKSGKTTAFNIIKTLGEVTEITLAGKLKDVCSQILQVDRDAFDSHRLKEIELENPVFLTDDLLKEIFTRYDLKPDFDKFIRPHVGKILYTPRQIAQYVGTEVLRSYKHDIHCDEAVKNVTGDIWVVTDMRFPDEFEFFSSRYSRFFPVYIQNTAAEMESSKDTHASEAHLKHLSRKSVKTLHNNSSLQEFQTQAKAYFQEILK